MNKYVLMAMIVLTFFEVVLELLLKLWKVIFQQQKMSTSIVWLVVFLFC